MKKTRSNLLYPIVLLGLVLILAFVLSSCSGNKDSASDTSASSESETTTETSSETETETSLESTDETTTESVIGAEFLPLTSDTVFDYVHDVYGYEYFEMKGMKTGSRPENTIYATFSIDDKKYFYLFNRDTGEAVISCEGVDELPEDVLETMKTKEDPVLMECCKLLEGYVEKGAEFPEDIKEKYTTKDDGTSIIIVSLTWRGEMYEFEYNQDTGTITQIKP